MWSDERINEHAQRMKNEWDGTEFDIAELLVSAMETVRGSYTVQLDTARELASSVVEIADADVQCPFCTTIGDTAHDKYCLSRKAGLLWKRLK